MEDKKIDQEEHLALKNKNILIERAIFIISIILIIFVMLFFIGKKEGIHCDEAFSYGSANSTYSNTFYSYWKTDPEKMFFDEYVKDTNIFKTIGNVVDYYVKNPDKKQELIQQEEKKQNTRWRTRDEAIDYMQITGNGDEFNFSSVFWNQISDVHPPLFYVVVNTVSSIFRNSSSKYIIFGINVVFFILTACVMRKILIEIKKRELAALTVLLYGLSIAGISTVIFLRMYMMLAFFTVLFLYLNIKIVNGGYKLSKKMALTLVLTTVGGFLTQYFFCIYALIVVIIMVISFIIKKKYKELFKYISIFIISAIIGIAIFPMSLYHMFFGERGVGFFGNNGYGERLRIFAELILNTFGANNIIGIALLILSVGVVVIIKRKESLPVFCLISIPIVFDALIIAQIAPFTELRYIMNILPIASIFVVMMVGSMFDNKSYETLLVSVMLVGLVAYGFITQEPIGLYKGYNKYITVAEENKDLDVIHVGYSFFNHIQFMPEFMIYKNTLIMSADDLYWLDDDTQLDDKNEFILSIETTCCNADEVLNTVLEKTGFENSQVLLEPENGQYNRIYKIYR